MKSLYLILAATVVIGTCKPQPKSNDIIWYPVDNEDGIFISIYGEKRRTPENSKWRSHRRARYSGMDPSWSFDPTENQDPSFFHNINQRRSLTTISSVTKLHHSFQNQELPFKQDRERFQGQRNQNDNFQDILNEVFGYNKYVSVNEYPGGRPGINNQWGNSSPTENQWSGNSELEKNNQWNKPQPLGSTSGFFTNGPLWQQTFNSNQWGSNTGFRTTERPTEWITQLNTKRPNNKPTSSNIPNRPTNQSDKLIFPDENSKSTTTSTDLIPMDPTTRSPCERMCPVTPEFNPVCGSDGATYSNAGRLKCAQACGKDIKLSHYGNCGRTPFVTPLVSKNSSRRNNRRHFVNFNR